MGKWIGVGLLSLLTVGIAWRVAEGQAKKQELQHEVRERMSKVTLETAASQPVQPAVLPRSETTKTGVLPRGVYFSGELRPQHEAELSFKVGGRLARIHVHPGDWVNEGQALLSLEDREAQAQLKQARAGVEAAKAQASMADDTAERANNPAAKNALSDQQRATVLDQARLGKAGLASAEAVAELAELNAQNHVLRAPFSGRITRVPAGVGVLMAPGLPVMGIADTSHWRVLATVAVEDGGRIKPGHLVEFTGAPLREGKVKYISPTLQERSRRVQVEVAAQPVEGAVLFAGQVVNGVIREPE